MRKLKLMSVLKDWAEWTSIPGPIQLVYSLNTFTRVLWLLIWLGAFGIFAFEFYLIVARYLQFGAEIDDSLLFEAKRFPVLTFCNNNPLKFNVVQNNANLANISALLNDYLLAIRSDLANNNNNYYNISNDHFGINKIPTRLQKEKFAQKALMLLAMQLPERVRQLTSYTFEDLVQTCYFNNLPCGRGLFTHFWTPLYGTCYRFNTPNRSSELYTFQAGKNAGLRLTLMAKQTDPISGTQLYLPTTRSAGIRLAAHMDNEEPALEDTGLTIGVGREVLVSMQNTKTTLLMEPYGECRNGDEPDVLNYYPNSTYTIESCLRSCRQNRTIALCGCADPHYAKPPNATWCLVENVFCLLEMDSEASFADKFSPIRDCGCRPACRSQTLELLNTQARSVNLATNRLSMKTGAVDKLAQWHQQNVIVLSVWFDGLDFIQHDQVESYPLVRASTDLGGQMGLWLGVSVISIFEVLTLLLMITLYFLQGRKVRLEPSVEELQRDWRYNAVQALKRELDIHEAIDERIRATIRQQRRDRIKKRREAEAELGKVEQKVTELAERAAGLQDQVTRNPEDAKLKAEAANARALVVAMLAKAEQLRELIEVLRR